MFRAGYAFGETSGRFDYTGEFNRENSRDSFSLRAAASGVEVLRFYGFGNETVETADQDFYKAPENQVLVYPSYTWGLARNTALTLGPVGRYSKPRGDDPTFVDSAPVYGRDEFGQVGAHAALILDGRDNPQYPRKGASSPSVAPPGPRPGTFRAPTARSTGTPMRTSLPGSGSRSRYGAVARRSSATIPSSTRPRWAVAAWREGAWTSRASPRGASARGASRGTLPSTATPTCACASGT